MGSLERRLVDLEARAASERPRNPEVRARMKAVLDELAAAKREGRPPSPEAAAVAEAMKRRRARRGA